MASVASSVSAGIDGVGPQEELESWGPLPLGENSVPTARQSTHNTASVSSSSAASFSAGTTSSRSLAGYSTTSSGLDGATIESDTSLALDQNALFLAHVHDAYSLSESMSTPSIGPAAHRQLQHQQRRSTTSLQYSNSSNPSHPTNNAAGSSAASSSDGSGNNSSSAWNNTNTTTTTSTFSFPTVTASSRNSSAAPRGAVNSEDATYDGSTIGYAASVVSIPSQVLPAPTTLENAVSGLTNAMPTSNMIDPSHDEEFLLNVHNNYDDNNSTNHSLVALPTTELRARTTTSSSLTTLSTTMANHAFHYEHARSLLAASEGHSSGSSSVTVHSLQQQQQQHLHDDLNNSSSLQDTIAAATFQADEDAKLKAASEFIPPPPVARAADEEEDVGESLQELEDMVLAKRGVAMSAAALPPERHKQDDNSDSFSTQQRELEEKLAGTSGGNSTAAAAAFDPHRLLQGIGALPVVQEQSILEELDALNRSSSQEDPYNVARRRATFVRPGAYHQAPGQVAIRRARSRADSLPGTDAASATSLLRHTSNATTVSDVSSIGMASQSAQQQEEALPPVVDVPALTRRHTFAGGPSARVSPLPYGAGDIATSPQHDSLPEMSVPSSSSSASASSGIFRMGAPAMSASTSMSSSAAANRSHTLSSGMSITTASSLMSSSQNPPPTAAVAPQEPPQTMTGDTRPEPSHRGLVQAHPVQPTDTTNIATADPVDTSDPSRQRHRLRTAEDGETKFFKLPLRKRHFVLLGLLFFLLFVGVIVAVVVVRTSTKVTYDPSVGFPNGAAALTFIPATERGRAIQERLDQEFGIREELEISKSLLRPTQNQTKRVSLSPYSKALQWLVTEDTLDLNASSGNLLQRFLMAYFYFHTSQEGRWVSCNPARGRENHFCSYRYVKPFDEEYDESPWHIRWLSGEHECEWAGVYCEASQVNELSLNGYNLSGTFPAYISKLRNLTALSLRDNGFRGRLPPELSELSGLRVLRMKRNSFTGDVPSSWAVLTNLLSLDVAYNSLTGSLPAVATFPLVNLENLWLDHNLFSGEIPSDVSLMSSLKQVLLNNNRFEGRLPEINTLTQLEYFDASSNELITGSLPSEFGLLTNLIGLVLSNTQLQGTIPDELYNLRDLVHLVLSGCNFTGTMSPAIGRLGDLQTLMLDGNRFQGSLPSELGRLRSLVHVQLQDNSFVGTVPDSICQLKGPNTLTELVADCTPPGSTGGEDGQERAPLISCKQDCCSSCCDPETQICVWN
ncbi:leucine Rich Repeat [Seminavis robusta]|uniref:Leucine Rich Repeat n=1 Tax=Seminavis robusta TaxID=568900 RepID=A0A9N8DGZ4_9STRA|nr:leucine Rich Repeat [Seminavis robusta]|eukprot:Sro115_g056830.1 leucine Rich Repeat (1249) ;mRNA; r:75555-79491